VNHIVEDLIRSGYSLNTDTKVFQSPDYQDIAYNDGDESENRVLHIIMNATELDSLSDELETHCTDWPSTYHLSKRRGNLMRPFVDHFKNKTILEIGSGMGPITRILGESGADVLALEGTSRRAYATRLRTRDLANVSVLAEKFDSFETELKFDFITLIGVLEYSNLYSQEENPHLDVLSRCFEMLNPNGKLIIAIENRLGLKYFAGAPEDHVGKSMFGIEDHYSRSSVKTFGKIELIEILSLAGFVSSNFASPLPDYKLTTSVISEAGFSFEGFDTASLTRDSFMQDPQLPNWINFSAERALFPIHRNKLGLDLANSFLIFANKNQGSLFNFSDLAWHFATQRKKNFCTLTKFVGTHEGEILVAKSKLFDSSYAGILLQSQLPQEKYSRGHLLRDEFEKVFTKENWSHQDLRVLLLDYFDKLVTKRILKSSNDEKCWLSEDSIDLLPHNICRLSNGELSDFDLEWSAQGPVDIRQMIFRTVLQFGSISTFERDEFGVSHSLDSLRRLVFQLLELEVSDSEVEDFFGLEISYQREILGVAVQLDELKSWSNKGIGKHRSSRLLAERDGALAERDGALAERDSIVNSTIWKMFTVYRMIKGRF
jgi:2-polyprenyl-3-methyl-5-hydroxy-6-metoxy-1,4-benzoquinol methylase